MEDELIKSLSILRETLITCDDCYNRTAEASKAASVIYSNSFFGAGFDLEGFSAVMPSLSNGLRAHFIRCMPAGVFAALIPFIPREYYKDLPYNRILAAWRAAHMSGEEIFDLIARPEIYETAAACLQTLPAARQSASILGAEYQHVRLRRWKQKK